MVETCHEFKKDLEFEQSKFEIQNNFYISKNCEIVRRVGYDSEEDKKLQNDDIDIIIKCDGKIFNISEKYRKTNYGDVLLEVYSSYEDRKVGWTKISKSDFIYIFIDDDNKNKQCVVGISTKSLLNFINSHKIFEKISDNDIKYVIKEHKTKCVNIDGYICRLISSTNETYHTISLCVPYKMLDDNGVKYTIYNYKW